MAILGFQYRACWLLLDQIDRWVDGWMAYIDCIVRTSAISKEILNIPRDSPSKSS